MILNTGFRISQPVNQSFNCGLFIYLQHKDAVGPKFFIYESLDAFFEVVFGPAENNPAPFDAVLKLKTTKSLKKSIFFLNF